MKKTLISGLCFLILILAAACDNSLLKMTDNAKSVQGEVIIRISGQDGRTIMPVTPVFNRFELTLQNGDNLITVSDTDGIDDAGVTVHLSEGVWTITLKGFQDILNDGNGILAAKGIYELTVSSGQSSYLAEIELKPAAIDISVEKGLFSFNITLPEDIDTAILNLKDSFGSSVEGYLSYNLMNGSSGSAALDPGYYDLSINLTKNGQIAGIFDAVHIYSGLESPAILDLSGIVFSDKVYIAGQLGGIRIGTVKIADESGNIIKSVILERGAAVRSDFWYADIPAENIGETLYAVLEFNNQEVTKIIPVLEAKGHDDVNLNLFPETAERVNLAPWYSAVTANGGNNPHFAADENLNTYWNPESSSAEIIIDYGFDVTVNFSRLMFYSESGATGLNMYNIDYWDGSAWVNLVQHGGQTFIGSTDGSSHYNRFFPEVTARQFRWKAAAGSAPPIIMFALYKAENRSVLADAIVSAEVNADSPVISLDGKDVHISTRWVTEEVYAEYQEAIAAAKEARDNPYLSEAEITAAAEGLAAAANTFNGAKQWGKDSQVKVEGFYVQDGYVDQFVISWITYSEYNYDLYMSGNNTLGTRIASFTSDESGYFNTINPNDCIINVTTQADGEGTGSISVIVSAESGVTRYFRIVPISTVSGVTLDAYPAAPAGSMTLGKPVLSLAPGYSYSTITAVWIPAQKADTYRVKYKYVNEDKWTVVAALPANAFDFDGNNFSYTFKPRGYNETANSGKELRVIIDALNEKLKTDTQSAADIYTSSNEAVKKLVGPAELNISASKAAAADYIDVSWNETDGASGYYVSRRQFDMNNANAAGDAVMYYVDASSAAVTGKNLGGENADAAVTATASAGNSRFTLRDAYMTDAEYSGAYGSYAQTYRDQQNDMAQGYPYRYIVIPVINADDFISYDNNSYTLGENGAVITWSNAVSIEETGYTIGFARNVTAAKGTYASTGNSNDGIQVTWEKPPLLAGSPQYTIYRRAHNGSWTNAGTSNTTSFVDFAGAARDANTRGIMYEYAVGISTGLEPYAFNRYMAGERARLNSKGIPEIQGYMLPMVTINRPSRNERKAGNDFAIEVTWNSAGIANGGSDANWGIDGYDVFVMNRNVDASWHRIADKNNQSNSVEVTNVQSGDTLQGGLLKVLRDYKQYFKVRSYVMNGTTKIYCPDPDWNYQTLFSQTSNRNNQDRADFLETAYVKWGARQITHTELVRAASIVLAWGIDPSSWQSTIGGSTEKTNGNNGSSGDVYRMSSSGVGIWWYDFNNYKPDMDTNANKNDWVYSVTFLTINTNSNQSGNADQRKRSILVETSGAGAKPNGYGSVLQWRESINIFGTRYDYGTEFFSVNGPSCLNGLYNAQMRFTSDQTSTISSHTYRLFKPGSANPGDGYIEVRFPLNASVTEKVRGGVENTALMFSGQNGGNSRRSLWY